MKYKTVLIDTDNGSCVRRVGERPANLPAVAVYGLPDADALKSQLPRLAKDFEVVVIDGTPRMDKLVGIILLMSDLTVIPLRP